MVIQPLWSGDDPETELVHYQTTAEKRAQKTHVTWVVGPQKQDGNEEAGEERRQDCLTLLILHFSRLHRVCGDTETFKRQLMGMTLALVEDLYPLVRAARVRVPPPPGTANCTPRRAAQTARRPRARARTSTGRPSPRPRTCTPVRRTRVCSSTGAARRCR